MIAVQFVLYVVMRIMLSGQSDHWFDTVHRPLLTDAD